VEAWKTAGRSLAGAARMLGVDPRTVKDRPRQAGVSAAAASTTKGRAAEARQLHEIVGSAKTVAALMGVSVSSVRRYLEDGKETTTRGHAGRPRLSEAELDRYVSKKSHSLPRTHRSADSLPFSIPHS
jgi:hypothetical protein